MANFRLIVKMITKVGTLGDITIKVVNLVSINKGIVTIQKYWKIFLFFLFE